MFSHEDGRKWEVSRDGHLTHFSQPGIDARFSDQGRLVRAHVVRPDHSEMTVTHQAYGRRYEFVRPDHARVIGYGPRRGFVERPIAARPGYVTRTYVAGRRTYAAVYRRATYRNMAYYRYVPARYYGPAYYTWATNPWASPAAYNWSPDDCSNFFAKYFTPDATYPSAAQWLTDNTLGENLKDAYEDRAQGEDAPAPPPAQAAQNTPPAVTPTLKRAIAEEVQQVVEAEQAAAAEPEPSAPSTARAAADELPPALDPKFRTFVVSQNVELDFAGQSCPLTPGDIIVRTSETPVEQTKVPVMVASSKPGSCPASSNTALMEIAELQEMYNAFREKVGSGLQTLAEKQGKGGIPPAPPPNPHEVVVGTAVPDLYAESEVQSQQQAALRTETEIEQDAAGN